MKQQQHVLDFLHAVSAQETQKRFKFDPDGPLQFRMEGQNIKVLTPPGEILVFVFDEAGNLRDIR